MRSKRLHSHLASGLLALSLCLAANLPAEARRAPARPRSRVPAWLRNSVLSGKIGWNSYLNHLARVRPSVFRDKNLKRSRNRFRILAENKDQQYAILRDKKALDRMERLGQIKAEHLLGIPTGKDQPIWLNRISFDDARRVGSITREALEGPRKIHRSKEQTLAYYHLPGCISQPILHAHGIWRPKKKPSVKSWTKLLRRSYRRIGGGAGYALYEARSGARGVAAEWPIVAVASTRAGKPSKMGPKTDRLLGRMILDVGRSTLGQTLDVLTHGRIEIDRADSRIAVRLVRRRQPSDTMYW